MITSEDIKRLIYNVAKEEVTVELERYSDEFNKLIVGISSFKVSSFHENYLTLDQLEYSIREHHSGLLRILVKKGIESIREGG